MTFYISALEILLLTYLRISLASVVVRASDLWSTGTNTAESVQKVEKTDKKNDVTSKLLLYGKTSVTSSVNKWKSWVIKRASYSCRVKKVDIVRTLLTWSGCRWVAANNGGKHAGWREKPIRPRLPTDFKETTFSDIRRCHFMTVTVPDMIAVYSSTELLLNHSTTHQKCIANVSSLHICIYHRRTNENYNLYYTLNTYFQSFQNI